MGRAENAASLCRQLQQALRRADAAEADAAHGWEVVSQIVRRAGFYDVAPPPSGTPLRAGEHRAMIRAFLVREARRARPGPLRDALQRWIAELRGGLWDRAAAALGVDELGEAIDRLEVDAEDDRQRSHLAAVRSVVG